jgi:protein-S-isoprenylcysteine O-methyltransferase Ste14
MLVAERLILACWLAFIAVWLVHAAGRKETIERGSFGSRLAYWLPLAIGSALIGKGFSHTPYPGNLGDVLLTRTPLHGWIGFALALTGLLVAIWARQVLGRNWSASVVVKDKHELVTSGPYARIRHPIYTGLLLMLLGSAVSLGTRAAFLGFMLCLLSCWIKLRQEEMLMIRVFPDSYPAYRTRTKRLVPFIW